MKQNIPKSPFTTYLSGSARETELRIRNIFQWKKKRPPVVLFVLTLVVLLSCFGLFSCQSREDNSVQNSPVEVTPLVKPAPLAEKQELPPAANGQQDEPVLQGPDGLKPLSVSDLYSGGSMLEAIPEVATQEFLRAVEQGGVPNIREGERIVRYGQSGWEREAFVLLDSIPEQNVYLYGYNSGDQYPCMGMVLDMGWTQTLYPIPCWYCDPTHNILPSLGFAQMGLRGNVAYVVLHAIQGTGVSVDELYMIRSGQTDVIHVDTASMVEMLNEQARFVYDPQSGLMQFLWFGNLVAQAELETIGTMRGEDFAPDSFFFGERIDYLLTSDSLRLQFSPTFYSEAMTGQAYLKETSAFSVSLSPVFEENGSDLIGCTLAGVGVYYTSTMQPPDFGALPEAAQAMRQVLAGEGEFIQAASGETMTLNKLRQTKNEKFNAFAVADLDGDGVPEISVEIVFNDAVKSYLLLHYRDGMVYGHSASYRGHMDLKTDGTFSWSSGAFDNGTGRCDFTGRTYTVGDRMIYKSWTIEEITYCQSGGYDEDGNLIKTFYVDRQPVSVEKYIEAEKLERAKPNAPWYALTEENIQTMIVV